MRDSSQALESRTRCAPATTIPNYSSNLTDMLRFTHPALNVGWVKERSDVPDKQPLHRKLSNKAQPAQQLRSAIVFPISAPPGTLLNNYPFNGSQIQQLNHLMSVLQCSQVVHALTKFELTKNIFFALAHQYIGTILHDT